MGDNFKGCSEKEVRTDQPTRGARLKYLVVVDAAAGGGRVASEVACVAAATSPPVSGSPAQGGRVDDSSSRATLPWTGCSVLPTEAPKRRSLREKAARHAGVLHVDMPTFAQEAQVYDGHLSTFCAAPGKEVPCAAVGLGGPRKSVVRLDGGLALLR